MRGCGYARLEEEMAAKADSGLLVAKGKAPLPLKSASVEARVRGFVMGLQSTLTYSNDSPDPVEVLFRFPVEKSHAVVGLTAVIDGRKIAARVREKEEARAQYDDAIASGLSAALAEEKSGDIFSIALGNLPPGKDARIQLQLVGELGVDAEGGVRFSLPSTLKPRYTPAGSTDPLAAVPAGEEEQVKSGTVSAVGWFHLTVEGADGVAEVTSPTHSITVVPNDANQLHVRLSKELDSDLVILVKHKSPYAPTSSVEPGAGKEGAGDFMSGSAVMVNFFPTLKNDEAACEFIFLVDRSGSMSGSFIHSARETLVFFLKSLPEGCYFNILGFGSSYEKLFPSSVVYNEKNSEKAMKHTQSMTANLGGTELLPPLKYIFGSPCLKGFSRQLFVLTDGSVSNTNACIQQVRANVNTSRCFTFGIGSGASSALVEGLAQAGNGTAEFVKEGERMQPKVIRSLKRALQPAMTDVSLEFKVPSKCTVLQSPQNLPLIFNGEKLVAYAVIQSKAPFKGSKCTAVLKGNMPGAKQKYSIPFTLDSSATAPSLPVIHHLAAKALITDWEAAQKEKKSIVDLSIQSSVISSHTAFIAVDEESSEAVSGSMKTFDLRAKGYGLDLSSDENYSSMSDNSMEECVYGACVVLPTKAAAAPPLPKPRAMKKKSQTVSSTKAAARAVKKNKKRTLRGIDDDDSNDEEEEYEEPQLKGMMDELCEAELEYELALWSEGEGQERVLKQRMEKEAQQASSDKKAGLTDLTSLITAQQVKGSWEMTSLLAQLIGKPLADLEAACPIGREGVGATVWATVLAVSVLRSRYSSQQDEWELIAMKAESWLKKQSLPSSITLEKIFQDAQKLLQ